MYVVYINLLYFLSIFLFTYNKNLLPQKKNTILLILNIYKNVTKLIGSPAYIERIRK